MEERSGAGAKCIQGIFVNQAWYEMKRGLLDRMKFQKRKKKNQFRSFYLIMLILTQILFNINRPGI